MKVQLRKASKKDGLQIMAINEKVQGNPWSLQSIENEIGFMPGDQTVAVALDATDKTGGQETLLGYLFSREFPGGAEILMIGVAANARRQGIGKTLINGLIGHLKSKNKPDLFLEVSDKNGEALAFYRSMGFQNYLVRKSYYSDGTDAICMKLKLAIP